MEIFLFLVVGAVSTAFNYAVFWIALDAFGIYYIFSSWAGYFAGVLLGFWLNSRYTFRAGPRPSLRQGILYFTVYLASLALSTLLLYLMVDLMRIPAKIANILAIMQSTTTNYLGCKFVVFRRKR